MPYEADLESSMGNEFNISGADAHALSERLEALYGARGVGELMQRGIELLRPFFSADYWLVGLCDPRRQRVIALGWPIDFPFVQLAERVPELAEQSPLFQYWSRTNDHHRVLRRSDCCDESAFRHTGLYNELFRPLSLTQQIGTWLRPGGGRHMEIGMYRSGSDRSAFSDRDVAGLALLRKHILCAYRNVLDFERGGGIARNGNALPAGTFELQNTALSSHIDREEQATESVPDLTPREREVLHWVSEGKTNQEIAAILGTKWRTVSKQLETIFKKLSVETRTAAAMRAVELRLHFKN
ncbi:MAG: hypothetical protein H7Z14_19010 [Anaerolineae bacterium]|nr:hypothetical protein [Phycisphaerae bacterium]